MSTPGPKEAWNYYVLAKKLQVLALPIPVMGVHNLAGYEFSCASVPHSSPRIAYSVVGFVVGVLSVVAALKILIIFDLAVLQSIAILILAIFIWLLVVAILRLLAHLGLRRIVEVPVFRVSVLL